MNALMNGGFGFTRKDEKVLIAGPDASFNNLVKNLIESDSRRNDTSFTPVVANLGDFSSQFSGNYWDVVLYDSLRQTSVDPQVPLSILESTLRENPNSNTPIMGFTPSFNFLPDLSFLSQGVRDETQIRAILESQSQHQKDTLAKLIQKESDLGVKISTYGPLSAGPIGSRDTLHDSVFLNTFNYHLDLRTQANEDGLTGLSNRLSFEAKLKVKYADVQRYVKNHPGSKRCLTLGFIDFDDFKNVNSIYGHTGGDLGLIHIARGLRTSFKRGEDTVGRIGGDEFSFAFSEDLAPDEALKMVDDKLAPIVDKAVELPGGIKYKIKLTVGVVSYPYHFGDATLQELMMRANEGMHFGKNFKEKDKSLGIFGYDVKTNSPVQYKR